jgi:hypothetical protein
MGLSERMQALLKRSDTNVRELHQKMKEHAGGEVVAYGTLCAWVNGERSAAVLGIIEQMATVLKVDPGWLAFGEISTDAAVDDPQIAAAVAEVFEDGEEAIMRRRILAISRFMRRLDDVGTPAAPWREKKARSGVIHDAASFLRGAEQMIFGSTGTFHGDVAGLARRTSKARPDTAAANVAYARFADAQLNHLADSYFASL